MTARARTYGGCAHGIARASRTAVAAAGDVAGDVVGDVVGGAGVAVGLAVGVVLGAATNGPAVGLSLALVAGGAAWRDAAGAEVYRWEDRGLTTYQDRAPDSDRDDGHAILNRQGVVLEKILSREERRSERQTERRRELARIRDRALLATFTTEEDLVRTRDDRIGMIDGLISRLDDRIRILSERLAVVDERVRMQEQSLGENAAQETLYGERRSIRRNIENAWSLIDSKAAERSDVAAKFDGDLVRYRELKGERRIEARDIR